MKIIKTKEIVPLEISELDADLQQIFKNRRKLHESNIPLFFAYIKDNVWADFLKHGKDVYNSIKHEAQGILLGKYAKDEFGEFVVAIKYAKGDGNSTHSYVEMSEERLSEISEICQRENLLMIVWLHTHPGFGVFYSSTDVSCLKTNFYKKYQLGIVVDILQKQEKGFKITNSDVAEFQDYKIIVTSQESNRNSKNENVTSPGNNTISDVKNIETGISKLEQKIKSIEEFQTKIINGITSTNQNIVEVEKVIHILKDSNHNQEVLKKLDEKIKDIIKFNQTSSEETIDKVQTGLTEVNQMIESLQEDMTKALEHNREYKDLSKRISKMEEAFENLTELLNQLLSEKISLSPIFKKIKTLKIVVVIIGVLLLGGVSFLIVKNYINI